MRKAIAIDKTRFRWFMYPPKYINKVFNVSFKESLEDCCFGILASEEGILFICINCGRWIKANSQGIVLSGQSGTSKLFLRMVSKIELAKLLLDDSSEEAELRASSDIVYIFLNSVRSKELKDLLMRVGVKRRV